MAKIQKSEKVNLEYKNNRIFIDGPGIKAILFIRYDDAFRLYNNETVKCSLDLILETPEAPNG